MNIRRLLFTCALFAFAPLLAAEERIDFSSPVAGAGSAGVAMGRGPAGAYYNPAAAAPRPWERDLLNVEFHMPALVSGSLQGVSVNYIFDTVQYANDLHEAFSDGAFQTGGGLTSEEIKFAFGIFEALDRLDSLNGEGVYVNTAAGIGARFTDIFMPRDGLAINVGGFGIGAFTPIVDLDGLRGYRLTDESAAQWEALIAEAAVNSGEPTPSPETASGQNFSSQLQAAGYSPTGADALAAWAEEAGLALDGRAGDLLLDFLINTLNGTGDSLESGANPLEGNESGLLLRGMAYYEIGFQYGLDVPIMGLRDWFTAGVGIKLIQAYTFSQVLFIEDMDDNGIQDAFDSLRRKLRDAYTLRADASRFNVGIDLGVTFTPQVPGLDTLAVSLVARNINGPEFRWPKTATREPSLVRFDPQVTLAASYTLFHQVSLPLTVGAEIDLNPTPSQILPRYHQQFFRAGVAFEPSFGLFGFGVRAGVFRNIVEADQSFTATLGAGIRVWAFSLDFAGQVGFEDRDFGTREDFEKVPQRLGFSAQLGFRLTF